MLCKFAARGNCHHGEFCVFAHGVDELRPRPHFQRTRLCAEFRHRGACIAGDRCNYAHGLHELPQTITTNQERARVVHRALESSLATVAERMWWDVMDLQARIAAMVPAPEGFQQPTRQVAVAASSVLGASSSVTTAATPPLLEIRAGPSGEADLRFLEEIVDMTVVRKNTFLEVLPHAHHGAPFRRCRSAPPKRPRQSSADDILPDARRLEGSLGGDPLHDLRDFARHGRHEEEHRWPGSRYL